MLLLIILIIVAILCALACWYFYDTDYNFVFSVFGTMLAMTIAYMIVHVCLWATASYRYKCLVVEREVIAMTLEHARSSENNIELAAITKNLCEFNSKLAEEKLDNSVFLLKDYVDDRVMDIKPIQ